MVADVLVEIKLSNKTFSYLIPNNLNVKVGHKVLVPFGKKQIEGFVINIKKEENYEYKLKEIIDIIDKESMLTEELMKIGTYMSKKTLTPLISCYQAMLPTALKAKVKTTINKKYKSFLTLNMEYDKAISNCSNDKQKEIINILKTGKILKENITKISSSYQTLIKKEIIKEIKEEEYRYKNKIEKEENNIVLNLEQKNVVNKVIENKYTFKPYLLYGVTGSGKTEVYMHIIENILNDGKEAIVLVPEISLTPQLINNFVKRFGSNIAVLHSRLSYGEKYDEWRKIERGEVKIVIGARSAIFAPFKNLGVIVIDEEHSNTYKQENNPKYNAIDMALFRGKYNNIPVILGSATPQIESYTRAKSNIYELIELKHRVNNSNPIVTLIDMKDEYKNGFRIISRLLFQKIKEKISKNEQVIILLNRRGFSTITTCKNCGYVHKCPNCDIPLTYHKTSNTYRCHYCGYGTGILYKCPVCNSKELGSMGLGTEKLEQYITENIFGSKVIRMDIDTTTKKGSHEKILSEFRSGKYNILLGTQMIAKGLDFPKVTLVGVINGDASLNIPDFRSGERTFQLLNQVEGRSGRSDLKGEVIIQAFNIDNYSITLAAENNYEEFYKQELKIRKKLSYPPFCNLCLIKIKSSKEEEDIFTEGNKISKYLNSQKLKDVIVLGPSASNQYKINNVYTSQILIKYKKTDELLNHLEYINSIYSNKKVSVEIDINPIKI